MKIDLFKLNNYNKIEINELLEIPSSYYENMDIRKINDVKVEGIISIDYNDDIIFDLNVSLEFILPCARTLEDVSYKISTNINENVGKFNNFYDNSKNSLDILPIIWENIVSEVPITVIKEGAEVKCTKGDGWELVSE